MTDTTTTPTTRREPTAIDALADAYVDDVVALSPIEATYLGIAGHDTELDDHSPAGYAAQADLARATLTRLAALDPVDDVDRVTVAAMRERLGLQVERHEAGADVSIDVISSPLQSIRGVFDLMPTATSEEWAALATRMAAVPVALGQWTTTLREAADDGRVSARRQVQRCIEQCAELTSERGYFADLLSGARLADGEELPEPVRADLERATRAAAAAYDRLGTDLATHLLARAPGEDAVGIERYRLASRTFLGARVDLEETYAWGQEELARITREMARTAERIVPGGGLEEAIAHLDADPAYRIEGSAALTAWMQERADEAVDRLGGTHFDIPEPVRRIEARIAPTTSGGIYYTGPSEDFTRPGRMWWSIPDGVTSHTTWRELSTVYHEGVPGHHLQIGQTAYRTGLLNRWRRMLCWVSGHGEGWALYAERLMDELGYLDDPGARLGFLDMQSLRAARVVVDIGLHCGFAAPASVGGGAWDYDTAWAFLQQHCHMEEPMLRFELDRYLGWPGQAPSYKIGERLWMQLRDEARERAADGFDLADFHRRALDVGSVGLDVLREALRVGS